MPSRSLSDLHPLLAYAWGRAEILWTQKYPDAPVPFLICTYRSPAEQNALYAQPTDGKDNDGDGKIDEPDEKVTNAKGGQSPHNYLPSYALDVAFKTKTGKLDYSVNWFDALAPLLLQTAGITWGGHFKSLLDRPHYEVTGWEKLAKQ